jgi:hypothetical protein
MRLVSVMILIFLILPELLLYNLSLLIFLLISLLLAVRPLSLLLPLLRHLRVSLDQQLA